MRRGASGEEQRGGAGCEAREWERNTLKQKEKSKKERKRNGVDTNDHDHS